VATPSTLGNEQMQRSVYPQVVIPQLNETGDIGMDRRDFLRTSLAAGAVLSTVTTNPSGVDVLDRFLKALRKPSSINATTLEYLEKRTASYWQDRHGAVVSSHDLLGYVLEDFQRATSLLECSLSPATRTRLCSIASEVTQLVGHLLFDMGHYTKAR